MYPLHVDIYNSFLFFLLFLHCNTIQDPGEKKMQAVHQWFNGAKAYMKSGSLPTFRIGLIDAFISPSVLKDSWIKNMETLFTSVALPTKSDEKIASTSTQFWHYVTPHAQLEIFREGIDQLITKPVDVFIVIIDVSTDDRHITIAKEYLKKMRKKKLLIWLHASNVVDTHLDRWAPVYVTDPKALPSFQLVPLARTLQDLSTAHFVARLGLFQLDLSLVSLVMGNLGSVKQVEKVINMEFIIKKAELDEKKG